MHLTDNFLVQFCGYLEYLITGETPSIRKLFLNRISLRPVRFVENRFKSRGVMKLASLIAEGKLPNLEILNLEDNDIDEEAARFLACCISETTTPHIQELHLGGNSLGDKGVITLFRYFRHNSVNSVTRLYLDRLVGLDLIERCSSWL